MNTVCFKNELDFQSHLIMALRTDPDCAAQQLHDKVTPGISDIVYCCGGRMGWAELKFARVSIADRVDPRYLPTVGQFRFLQEWRSVGAQTAIVICCYFSNWDYQVLLLAPHALKTQLSMRRSLLWRTVIETAFDSVAMPDGSPASLIAGRVATALLRKYPT